MKIILFLVLCVNAGAFTKVHSQLIVPSASESPAKSATGKAMLDLAQALKKDTYTKTTAKDKATLLTNLHALTTPSEASAALVTLSKMIKPGKFKSGFNTDMFAKTASSLTTLKEANELLLNLESGLMPNAFNPMWKMQRTNWLSEVK